MNIVDSSAWLEYFANTKNAKHFAIAIEKSKKLIVPTVILYEVFKKVLKEKDEHVALTIAAHMKRGKVVSLNLEISLRAAKISALRKIPMVDSIILATAEKYDATVWTQDSDFRPFSNAKYFQKK
jgi:toxin FitB